MYLGRGEDVDGPAVLLVMSDVYTTHSLYITLYSSDTFHPIIERHFRLLRPMVMHAQRTETGMILDSLKI
jgi:hypothetical protein